MIDRNLLQLSSLYKRRMVGERFVDAPKVKEKPKQIFQAQSLENIIFGCMKCQNRAHSKKNLGQIPPHFFSGEQNKNIVFVTLLPTFLQNTKSSQMLENIIKNVFCLDPAQVAILSLIKCAGDGIESKVSDEEKTACAHFINEQLLRIKAKIIVLFGADLLRFFIQNAGDSVNLGTILWHNSRNFLATHSLNLVVRNPSLKREIFTHLLAAKDFLDKD